MSAAVNTSKCDGCGECLSSCPLDAIVLNDDGKAVIDCEICGECGTCIDVCPRDAITLEVA
jgi:ferredoxin